MPNGPSSWAYWGVRRRNTYWEVLYAGVSIGLTRILKVNWAWKDHFWLAHFYLDRFFFNTVPPPPHLPLKIYFYFLPKTILWNFFLSSDFSHFCTAVVPICNSVHLLFQLAVQGYCFLAWPSCSPHANWGGGDNPHERLFSDPCALIITANCWLIKKGTFSQVTALTSQIFRRHETGQRTNFVIWIQILCSPSTRSAHKNK